MLGNNGKTVYSGAIGKDEFSKTLIEKVNEAGIDHLFYVQDEAPTGTCAVLVSGPGHRSLIANLAAANTYKKTHLDQGKKIAPKNLKEIFHEKL